MTSTWIFACKMGLRQDDCGQYIKDHQSRGAERWSGCASCIHRKAYDQGTQDAEDYHAQHAQQTTATD